MLYFPKIFFDSCAFNPPQETEKTAMDELEKIITDTEDITIEIPYSVKKELSKAPKWIQKKIALSIYTLPQNLTDEEKKTQHGIQFLLFGAQQNLNQNQINDTIHIFEAQKYGCRFFVTLDKKHILSKGINIEKRFSLRPITPSECLKIVKKFFQKEREL